MWYDSLIKNFSTEISRMNDQELLHQLHISTNIDLSGLSESEQFAEEKWIEMLAEEISVRGL